MSCSSERSLAIHVASVSKLYEIYDKPIDRLKQGIVPRLQRRLKLPESRYFQAYQALKDVTFSIGVGETVGIIGRNGAGKSTLLQIVCRTLFPTSGEVDVRGRVAALLELGAGFNPEFSGRENVYMSASVLGLSNDEIALRYDRIVEFADIGEFIEQPVKTYSSGMYVRLAFAVIAHVDADILVIDEALAVGDVFFTQKCMRFLRQFMQRGTVLFVSHDIASINSLCERVILLEQGAVVADGPAKEVTERYVESAIADNNRSLGIADVCEISSEPSVQLAETASSSEDKVDCRRDFVNATALRNDIEVFTFNSPLEGVRTGGASIDSVTLNTIDGKRIKWLVGGEKVVLCISIKTEVKLSNIIVGFYVNDKLGQRLFGDNTYLRYIDSPMPIEAKRTVVAEFQFCFPILPAADYSITVAVADGTQADHVQHHWVHDAIVLRSLSSSLSTGLVGIPMQRIELAVVPPPNPT